MANATGIELCPDSCLLTGIHPLRGGDTEVFALRRLEGPYWPTNDQLIAQSLSTIRETERLPSHACVVAWEFDNTDTPEQTIRGDVLGSIGAAGFQVDSVLTPSRALLRLAMTRRRTSPDVAVAWLAINKCGAAIAIVRGTELLFERTIRWNYKPDLKTGKAQALQRYLLVAHLAPELSHGIDLVRAEYGLPVDLAVTCGDLPDLRSLTMPLIEELDLEVETLDSTDGLRAARDGMEGLVESAPAMRLSIAATIETIAASRRDSIVPALLRATAVIALGVAAWASFAYWSGSRAPSQPRESTLESAPQPIATQGRREPDRATTPEPSASGERPQQSENASTDGNTVAASSAPPQLPTVPPLKEPLPRIDTVLIDRDRRLAFVDGRVVAVGDTLGSRVVIGIDRDRVVLREPSGRTVTVRVRSGSKS